MVVHSYCSLRVLWHAEKIPTTWKTYYFDSEKACSQSFIRKEHLSTSFDKVQHSKQLAMNALSTACT